MKPIRHYVVWILAATMLMSPFLAAASQHDYEITSGDANTGIAYRAAVNAALQALASSSSGATAPATPFANQLWADTDNGLLKIRNPANDAWITIGKLSEIYLGLAALSAQNDFTSSQKLKGDALLLRLKDSGASGAEWAIRSDEGNLEVVLNTGTESAPVWTVQARVDINTLRIGNGTSADIDIVANNNAANKPRLRYQASGSKWQYSNDGEAFIDIGTGDGGDLPAGGSTGQVLAKTSGADYDVGWVTQASASKLQQQIFTSSGTFTFPAGTTAGTVFKFVITGAGGNCYSGTWHGGAAGGTAIVWLSGFTAGQTITVTVGAIDMGDNNYPGGSSTISSGTASISTVTGGGGPAGSMTGGTASGGHINITGGGGLSIDGTLTGTKLGGSSYWGSAPAYGAGRSCTPKYGYYPNQGAGIVVVEWVL